MRAYHFLKSDMRSGEGDEPPWEVGQTRSLPKRRTIVPCEYGYHASPSLWDALQYAPGPIACLVELDGDVTEHGSPVDKMAGRTRTLLAAVNIESELRLFAADCAEHVLWIYERDYPGDDRPRKAIEAARVYARGEIDAAAEAAARDAARAAARDAAGDAAWDAAWAAEGDAAGDAAWAAARTTAGAAAWAAAWDAAGDAARAAAGAAARDAAWDAARDAEGDAAGDAARAAARDAERSWQREQFRTRFGHIFGEGE